MRYVLALSTALILLAAPALAKSIDSSVDASSLPKKKQTPLGLYLTPEDAHRALTADPEIVFVDVRDPIEVSFVGHAASMDANVPVAFASGPFDATKGAYKLVPNKRFATDLQATLARLGHTAKETPIFLMCRSGARSAAATKILAAAGYSNVWNLTEGFEGDRDKVTGARSKNGWRNAGLPWSYKLNSDAAWREAR